MTLVPTDIARTENGLSITWSDGEQTSYTVRQLRDACPCATCRERRRGDEDAEAVPKPKSMTLPVLSAAETKPIEVLGMKPVGNYAYGISFSDGHDSGLFTFDFLRQLSANVADK